MSSDSPQAENAAASEGEGQPVAQSGPPSARSVLIWAVRVGLVGGLAFGLVQAVALAWQHRSFMTVRQWADVLSYSCLSHAVFWVVYEIVLTGVLLSTAMRSHRIRRGVRPGALMASLLLAGTTTMILWIGAFNAGIPADEGFERNPTLLMGTYWLLALVASYTIAHHVVRTWVARWVRRLVRAAFWPVGAALLGCLAIQWYERPRLLEPTTRWKDAAVPSSERGDRRPNVVLIILDTQRVDRLGCYGYDRPTTPRLDAFAADALLFENCISPAIWTLPAHASMFTGLFPSEHGANLDHRWLDSRFQTMAELLNRVGYETVAFSNNIWVTQGSNLTQGFEQLRRPMALHRARGNTLMVYFSHVLAPAGLVGKWLGWLTSRDEGAKYTNQLVARWLDGRNPQRPFFLFINYMEPHWRYRPPLPHRQLFVSPQDIRASYRHSWDKHVEFVFLKRDCYTPAELKLLNDTYDGETRVLDDYLGELLEILAKRVPLDDTLIVITADHGENLGDHHLMDHAWCVYDTLAHVPLIVRYPKRLQAGRSERLVQLTDLLPTVVDAVYGCPMPTASTFGQSLLPRRRSTGPSRLPPATEPVASAGDASDSGIAVVERIVSKEVPLLKIQRFRAAFDRTSYLGVLRAIRRDPWKYIVAADGAEELYHVIDDPGETKNVMTRYRPIARQLAEELKKWIAATKPYQRTRQAELERFLSDEARRRLRDLGYLH